jgi:thiol:disulfide interchange protein DsbA
MEKEVEPLIVKIVANERARVTYIDTPMHRETIVYERYYLCAVKNATHDEVLRVRRALFAAAEKNIRTDDELRAFLDKSGIQTAPCDLTAVIKVMNGYFREDGITSTPTCVIVTPKGKTVYTGKNDITAILRQYAQ